MKTYLLSIAIHGIITAEKEGKKLTGFIDNTTALPKLKENLITNPRK